MPDVTYTPHGRDAYTCELVTPGGLELAIDARVGELPHETRGSDELRANPAVVVSLTGYGQHEAEYRRLRADEKRESHRSEAERHRKEAVAIARMVDDCLDEWVNEWCSACFTNTTHQRVDDDVLSVRTYLCGNCGSPTTPCAVPGCEHMANRGTKRVAPPKYCAEHRHEIPGFDRLDASFEQLDDYEAWLEFEVVNAARITKLSLGTLATGVLLAPAAFLAAPAIGGATGVLTGLHGAAATSHGLALWGGGALAAGGLGMAGGTIAITAVGGALGGALGATVTRAYVNADSSFGIERLRDGEGPPVIFATGFLTEGQDGWGDWEDLIDQRYVDHPVYRVNWGAKEKKALGISLGEQVGWKAVRQAARKWAMSASKRAAPALGPLGGVLAATSIAKNPWTVAKTRAGMTGAILADLLARTGEERFILMGHSLGGRVMVSAASALGTRDRRAPQIEAVHLFGAAVSREHDWGALNDAVAEAVWNYWSRNDSVLANGYRLAELNRRAVGQAGFGSKFRKIRDRDVSRSVKTHSEYVAKVRLASP